MEYKIIASGSSGNALLFGSVLIDCGVPYKRLQDEKISLVLLTHEHQDHFKMTSVVLLAKNNPNLRFGAPNYMVPHLWSLGIESKRIDIMVPGKKMIYNKDLSVWTFPLLHDVSNVGYVVEVCGETAFYATDTGYLSHLVNDYSNLDYYFVEANYDAEKLYRAEKAKREAGEYSYEARVRQTHLSIDQANDFIRKNARPDSVVEYMHRHVDKEDL